MVICANPVTPISFTPAIRSCPITADALIE
jgi:hypothetical protein